MNFPNEEQLWRYLRGAFFIVMTVFGMSGLFIVIYEAFMPPLHQRFYDRAVRYERQNRWEEAFQEYEKAHSEAALSDESGARKTRRRALRRCGDLLTTRLGKLEEGARRYWTLSEEGGSDENARYALQRLVEMYRDYAMDCRHALPPVQRYLSRFGGDPLAPEFARTAIRCLVSEDDLVQARIETESFLAQWPRHSLRFNVQMDLGNGLFSNEQYGEALDLFQKLAADPETPETVRDDAIVMTGRCLLESGRFDRAEEVLKQALEHTAKPQVVNIYLTAAQKARRQNAEQQNASPQKQR